VSDEYEQDYFVYWPPPFSEQFPYPDLAWGETSSFPFSKGPVRLDSAALEFVECYKLKKPQYPDCMKLGGTWPVVSKRVCKVLEELRLYGVDLHPTRITTRKGERLCDYKLVHVWNKLRCIDRERTQAIWYEYPENSIREEFSLRLDREVMAQTPLERRLVFRLAEFGPTVVFHRTVVEQLMAIRPTGIMFAPFATSNESWISTVQDTPFPPVIPEKPALLRKPPTRENLMAAEREAMWRPRRATPDLVEVMKLEKAKLTARREEILARMQTSFRKPSAGKE